MTFRQICVYCGSSEGERGTYKEAAIILAEALATRGLDLVYGGGSVGLMGVIADILLERGRDVTGVITRDLWEREVGHDRLTENHIVDTMHERKKLMYELADGFVILPGGYGTLDEFFEIVTWLQLKIHRRPVGILNVDGYFDRLFAFLDHARGEGFVSEANRRLILHSRDVDDLLDRMDAWQG